MWYWYINGVRVPYQNRNLRGVAVDMIHITNDWIKGEMLAGRDTQMSSIELRWEALTS